MAKQPTHNPWAPTDESLKKYLAIVKAIQTGRAISKEDGRFLMEHQPQNEAELAALNAKVEEAQKKGIVPKDLDAEASLRAGQSYLQSPAFKETLAELAADQKAGALSDRLTNALGFALAGGDVAQSINQIKSSKEALAKSIRPGRPAPITADENLQHALRQAQEGTYDVSKQLAPAQAAANDQYLADIQNAKTASAGQSGAFGAYTQAAANRRNRAGLEQSALGSQIMQQNRQNYAGLLGVKQQENRNIFDSQNANYGTDMHQYQLEQASAANTGLIGRENLNAGLNSLAAAGRNAMVDAYRDRQLQLLHTNMDRYGKGDAARKAVTDLATQFGKTHAPIFTPSRLTQQQIEQSLGHN